jgi:hypothetical protein
MIVIKLTERSIATIIAVLNTTISLGHCGQTYLNIRQKAFIQQLSP